jgi:hypothetical protein
MKVFTLVRYEVDKSNDASVFGVFASQKLAEEAGFKHINQRRNTNFQVAADWHAERHGKLFVIESFELVKDEVIVEVPEEKHLVTLHRLLDCFDSWEGGARVVGDVRADDSRDAIRWVVKAAGEESLEDVSRKDKETT